jgi:endoribonuclease LACTB2
MRSSVALILMHDGQIFMIKRKNDVPSFPGYASFPGGLIDKKDESSEEFSHPLIHGLAPFHQQALRREMMEELGFDIAKAEFFRFGLIGSATTPSFNPYRFETFFYYAECVNQPDFVLDDRELESGQWQSPRAFLERYHAAELLAVPVTVSLLEALSEASYWRRPLTRDFNLQWNEETECPMIEPVFGVKVFMPLSHTLPPASRTNCFLIGGELLVDPSPKDEQEFQRLLNSLSSCQVKSIFLTHHHGDHYEQSAPLARMLGVPMTMSRDTYDRITRVEGGQYFDGVKIHFAKAGDTVARWHDQDVIVYELPGHDQGQLGLAPLGLEWFVVGDLVQSIGTVVIKAPEGDMDLYFESLKKVILLNPAVIFPSHGIAMGGVYKLEETLKHRQMRHQQVRELRDQGKTTEEIVDQIYLGLEDKLRPLAWQTIESHLRSLNKAH